MILAIACFIDWLETRAEDKQTRTIERKHEEMYALIDENYSGREARERKARVDAMIGALHKDNGKEYKPKRIKQVTTVEERKRRIKAELNGTATNDALIKAQMLDALDEGFACLNEYDDCWIYEEHTDAEKRERLIQDIIASGSTRAQAEKSADEFMAFAKGN
jgi:hypothetical protein